MDATVESPLFVVTRGTSQSRKQCMRGQDMRIASLQQLRARRELRMAVGAALTATWKVCDYLLVAPMSGRYGVEMVTDCEMAR